MQALVYFFITGLLGTAAWAALQAFRGARDEWRVEGRIERIGVDQRRGVVELITPQVLSERRR